MNEKCTHSLDFPHSSRGQRPRCQPKPTSRPSGALETIFGTCAPTPDGPFWLAASKPTREDGSNQIRLKIKAFRRNQTKIKPDLTLFKPKKRQRHLHPVKKSASICEICGSDPVLKIKKPSQNARKTLKVNKGQLRLYDTPRGSPFLSAILINL